MRSKFSVGHDDCQSKSIVAHKKAKASPPAVQETVHFKHLLRGTLYLDVNK